MQIRLKKKKAFSLIEMIVSLGIIMLILTLFFNIITSIIDVAIKTNTRAQAREEVATAASLLRSDIRNANTITDCGDLGFETSCTLVTASEIVTWRICDSNPSSICRYESQSGSDVLVYQLPDALEIVTFGFEVGYAVDGDDTKQNIIFNLGVSNINESLEVDNVLSNISVSTRNYEFASAEADLQSCGNGVSERGEECDDGDSSNTNNCLNTCTAATCGDGYTLAGSEQCDDANSSNSDACINTCRVARCGDGYRRSGVEQCDDSNSSNSDACLNNCRVARCGDGYRRAGVEQCDDGNTRSGDGCSSTCRTESTSGGGGGGGCSQSGGTCCVPGTTDCDGCSSSGTCAPNDAYCGGSPNDNRRRCPSSGRTNSVGCCLN